MRACACVHGRVREGNTADGSMLRVWRKHVQELGKHGKATAFLEHIPGKASASMHRAHMHTPCPETFPGVQHASSRKELRGWDNADPCAQRQ